VAVSCAGTFLKNKKTAEIEAKTILSLWIVVLNCATICTDLYIGRDKGGKTCKKG
jgi:hypothetical protein